MIADLIQAVWIALLGGALVLWAARGATPGRWIAPFALTAALVLVSPFGPGLTCYSSDLWMYITLAERVALGDWLLGHEALWLEAPADPHHAVEWMIVGRLHHLTGVSSLALTQIAGVLVVAALSVAVWRLAREAFAESRTRWIAMVCFWMMSPTMWASVPLPRVVTLIFVIEAARATLVFRGTTRDVIGLALVLALAFYAQSFGGIMAIGAAGLVALARWRHEPPPLPALTGAGALALLIAAPIVASMAAQSGLRMADAYLHGPGDVRWLGFLWFSPAELVHQSSAIVIALAVAGAWPAARAKLHPALRTACLVANAGLALLLFTPIYQVAVTLVGGWMVPRLAFLGFWWLPAAAALAALLESRRQQMQWAGTLAAALLFWQGGARIIRDYQHPDVYRPVTAEMRAEAVSLRDLLKDHLFLSSPHLSYVLAAYSLGKPLAVPPGHASPFHPFERRERDAVAALTSNSADCWAALVGRYPGLRYLVTPFPSDAIEADLWRAEIPGRPPYRVREDLLKRHALVPVRTTRLLHIDAIVPSDSTGDAARCGAIQ